MTRTCPVRDMVSDSTSVEVSNHTDFYVDEDGVETYVQWFSRHESFPFETLSVGVIGDEEMARLNETYHHESGPTDVLSFDYEDGTAEVLLNPYQHQRQSDEFDNDTNEEFTENLLHGLLHLSGFDHTADEGEHLRRQADMMEEWSGDSEQTDMLRDDE